MSFGARTKRRSIHSRLPHHPPHPAAKTADRLVAAQAWKKSLAGDAFGGLRRAIGHRGDRGAAQHREPESGVENPGQARERVTRLFPVPHACGFLMNCRRKEPVIIDRYEVVFGGCFAVAKQPAVPRRAQSHTPSNARHPSNACGRVVGRPILHTERSPWSVWWTCSLVPTARKMRYRYSPGSSRVGQSHLPARSRKTQFHFETCAKDSPVNGTSAPVFRLMSDS